MPTSFPITYTASPTGTTLMAVSTPTTTYPLRTLQTYANSDTPYFAPFGQSGPTGSVGPTGSTGSVGPTGSTGPSFSGVASVTAGVGVSITGTPTAPVVNNTITSSINNVLNIWSSTPISVSTPVGGAITTLVTYGSFVVGKTYLISFAGDIACGSTTISTGDKGMLMGIQPVGTGEQLVFCESPVNYTGTGFATSFTYTAPQTSLNVYVQGDGTNTEVVIGTLSNVTIMQLN